MKKMLAFVLILFSAFLLFGCTGNSDINSSFSEITRVYYNGISPGGEINASISVGEREQPYIIDGKHGQNVDFSLIVVKCNFEVKDYEITVDFFTDNQKNSVNLEFNPLNNTFMADLGIKLDENATYSLIYKNIAIEFNKSSDDFKIDYKKAIDKSIEALGSAIDEYYSGDVFKGECYLKILNKPNDDFLQLYWIFTVIGENGNSNNVLIDLQNGDVVLSN